MASSSTFQYQELLIDPSPHFLPLHTSFSQREIIVARLEGRGVNARHPEGGTEDSMEDSYEEGFQGGDGIAPTSKSVMMVSHKEERGLKSIEWAEEVLINADGVIKEKDMLKEN